MRNKASITFFIPAYNCEHTIQESIESIFCGNFNEDGDELIVVNDGSVDNTAQVLEECKSRYPFMKVVNHPYNRGGGAARNTAVEHAKNELLFCLDSDNILEKSSISALKNYLVEMNADVAVFQLMKYFLADTSKIEKMWTLPAGEFPKERALFQCYTPGSGGNYLFTRSSWLNAGGYPTDAGSLDTWGFGLRQLLTDAKTVVLEDSYYFHRLTPDSYYLRDAWARRKSVSLRATQLLIPFLDHINNSDINYIFSKKHRYDWYDHLDKRPIQIINNKKSNLIWAKTTSETSPSLLKRVSGKIKNLLSQ